MTYVAPPDTLQPHPAVHKPSHGDAGLFDQQASEAPVRGNLQQFPNIRRTVIGSALETQWKNEYGSRRPVNVERRKTALSKSQARGLLLQTNDRAHSPIDMTLVDGADRSVRVFLPEKADHVNPQVAIHEHEADQNNRVPCVVIHEKPASLVGNVLRSGDKKFEIFGAEFHLAPLDFSPGHTDLTSFIRRTTEKQTFTDREITHMKNFLR